MAHHAMKPQQLRRQAVSNSLFRPTTLDRAVDRMGFIQADPIRSPARAQDLILRHRVKGYRAGDLERRYASLGIEEDYLYAYGFVTRPISEALHPRDVKNLSKIERQILDIASTQKTLHPKDLEAHLGRERQLNAWGGYSKATTRSLHALHHRGLLRVAGRENGIRLYALAGPPHVPAELAERLRRLVLAIVRILSPISETSLRATLQLFARGSPHLPGRKSVITALVQSGDLQRSVVDEVSYISLAGMKPVGSPKDAVYFLAPFDPVVWDRRRFEHLWGWPYRFEAYTPLAKRTLGYYAMPVLWRDDVVGWVNISNTAGNFAVDAGYVRSKPAGSVFAAALEREIDSFRRFLPSRRIAASKSNR